MDRRERLDSPEMAMLQLTQLVKSEMWCAMPGIIQSFDGAKLTCSVQLAIQVQVTDETLTSQWTKLPVLVDCPVVFPAGGGCMLTFPIAAGDECLVVFADRCIDAWWQSGGVQTQMDSRMHDLSDGFVIPGPRSQPNKPGAAVGTNAELRTMDGTARVGINPATKEVKVQTTGDCSINATNINLNGVVKINGQPFPAHTHNLSGGGTTLGVT